ncbi:uncharacterized protein [Euwallacea fornicatus]|uniref:uncharacterized protein n=1 Tax=Euwallacea fornicatus TaxID=995702 RepID=UPI00338F3AE8
MGVNMVSRIFVSAPVCILTLYFTLLTNGVSAKNITCYSCSSYPNNSGCSDPLGSNVPTISCDGSVNSCYKAVYKIRNDTVTSRGCYTKSNATCASINATLIVNNTAISDFSCLECRTDLCNSSVAFGVSLITVVATLLSLTLL